MPGGWLSFRFGGRIVLCFSMLIGSLMTITLPFFARYSYNALFVGLFITGACHGAFFPSVSCPFFLNLLLLLFKIKINILRQVHFGHIGHQAKNVVV